MGYGGGDWQEYMKLIPKVQPTNLWSDRQCATIDTPSFYPQVTTIVLGAYSDSTWSMDMICRAHAEDVRVLVKEPHGLGSKFQDQDQFGNVTMIANWIHDKVLTPKCLQVWCSYVEDNFR